LKEVPALLRAAYLRGCYLLQDLGQCPEEELTAALDSLSSMRELLAAASTIDLLDDELFWNAAASILKTHNHSHPAYSTICGAIAGLLFSSGRMNQTQLMS
jgi:hypothetical protein